VLRIIAWLSIGLVVSGTIGAVVSVLSESDRGALFPAAVLPIAVGLLGLLVVAFMKRAGSG
jgi:hypothetical protein